MDTTNYKPVGEVLNTLSVLQLPENCIALDAVIVVKALDADGNVTWHTRYTEAPHAIEFLGALEAACMLIKQDIFNQYNSVGEDDG